VVPVSALRIITKNNVTQFVAALCGVGDGDLNFYTGFDGDGSDLLHDLGRGVEIDDALVDAHLVFVESDGTLTTRGLVALNHEALGREADGALHLEALLDGTALEIGADLLEVSHVAARESDADPVDTRLFGLEFGCFVHDEFTNRGRKTDNNLR
jgi:hypothetical protein